MLPTTNHNLLYQLQKNVILLIWYYKTTNQKNGKQKNNQVISKA